MSQQEQINYPEWVSREAIPHHWIEDEEFGLAIDTGRCLTLKKLGERLWFLDKRRRVMHKVYFSEGISELDLGYCTPHRYDELVNEYQEFVDKEVFRLTLEHPNAYASEINLMALKKEVPVGRHPWEEEETSTQVQNNQERPKIKWNKNLNTLVYLIHVLEEAGYITTQNGKKRTNKVAIQCFVKGDGTLIDEYSYNSTKNQISTKGGNSEYDQLKRDLNQFLKDLESGEN
jgi:hypothetical protein